MINKKYHKRWSSWLTMIAAMIAGAMQFIPDIGLEATTASRVLLGFTVVLSAIQSIKQDFDDDANGE